MAEARLRLSQALADDASRRMDRPARIFGPRICMVLLRSQPSRPD
jgi:hypothetical protein